MGKTYCKLVEGGLDFEGELGLDSGIGEDIWLGPSVLEALAEFRVQNPT